MRRTWPLAMCAVLLAVSVGEAAADEAGLRVIHVAKRADTAADANPGTSERPLETISRALVIADSENAVGRPVHIVVHPGVYRESLVVERSQQTTDASLVIESAVPHKAVVSGSAVWKRWSRTRQRHVYRHRWRFQWGLSPIPEHWAPIAETLENHPVLRRRELVFLDGVPLRQKLRRRELRGSRRAFVVSEKPGQIRISPPRGSDLGKAKVEVAVRPQLLSVVRRSNITIDGLVFQHANSPLLETAVHFEHVQDAVVRNSIFRWNNFRGIKFNFGTDIRLESNRFAHNGFSGLSLYGSERSLLSSNQSAFNNWRGRRAQLSTWAVGDKFFLLRDASFVGHRSIGNYAPGLWFDTDNARITISDAFVKGNRGAGIKVEASQGPFEVAGSVICGNRIGVLGLNSANLSLREISVLENGQRQILIAGNPLGPRDVTNHTTGETMRLVSEHWTLHTNVFYGRTARGALLATTIKGSPWQRFVETLSSDFNTWSSGDRQDVFQGPAGRYSLLEWQDVTGQDSASTFTQSVEMVESSCTG